MGPLWASADLWGVLTDYVQVATVVEAKPDATSTLFCSGQFGDTSIQVGTQLSCVVNIQTNRQPIAGSLDDFSIFLDGRSIYFTYTVPSSSGFEQLHVTFNVSSEIVGSPFNITVWESKPDSDDGHGTSSSPSWPQQLVRW
ncbi:uncharacterized protein ACA1_262340 [Acanthamoeba castellanii str. Neff]|uniref:Uncharacterized protein n=1 Tax=Acanthamoeba castellanii (strain ATCC 30010 / Neff) TaxID=1257118 RepID=L8H424_ACACF|nr:uncharacterized protein ACA1_262340 [Acanthamoeba castellanii str. Neff]ELR19186.1 hypothetical protein ACA1_262340 [Acanthamoeba castellanii str. Neff]